MESFPDFLNLHGRRFDPILEREAMGSRSCVDETAARLSKLVSSVTQAGRASLNAR